MSVIQERHTENAVVCAEERVVQKAKPGERITCRDKDGNARIIDGYSIMQAIERLARIEERAWGVMIAEPTELQKATAEGQRKRREAERRGASE